MDIFTSLLDQLARQNTSEKPVPFRAERKKMCKAEPSPKPFCLRCPPSLKHEQRNSVTKLCRDCSTYYCQIKRETGNPDLSAEDFIRGYPSRYILRPCQRCRPELKKKAGKLGLCTSCCSYFYSWRKSYRTEHPEEPCPTVELFLKHCPARKEKTFCKRCPSHLSREAVRFGLCPGCATGFYQWRRKYSKKSSEEADLTVETFLEQRPRRYQTKKVIPLCIRCSEHAQQSSVTRLCGSCGTYYRQIKKGKNLPDLSVEEFIKMHPARKRC